MENKLVLVNRFSPGNPKPIYFAGRKSELTEYFLLLQSFLQDFSAGGYSRKVHILKGRNGIGKTTFLLRFRKQIQDDVSSCIPIYISATDFSENINNFYRLFFQEAENSINTSPSHRELFLSFLRKKNWQHIALKISPSLLPLAYKLLGLDAKSQNLRIVFDVLKEAYRGQESCKEMIILWNWILQEMGLNTVLLLDHLEAMRSTPDLLETFFYNLQEMGKNARRFFLLISMNRKDFDNVNQHYSGPQLPLVFNNVSSLSIREEKKVNVTMESLLHRLSFGEKLAVVQVSHELIATQIIQQINKNCSECGFSVYAVPTTEVGIVQCVQLWCQELLAQIKNRNDLKLSDNILSECQNLVQQIFLENNFSNIFPIFCKFFTMLDSTLTSPLVLFISNFDRLLGSPFFGTVDKVKLVDHFSTRTNVVGCSSAFLQFFQMLEQFLRKLSKISYLLLIRLPDSEWALDSANKSALFLMNSTNKTLHSFPKIESFQLMQEIFARSGVTLTPDIAEDIYQKIGGCAIDIHFLGSYLLNEIPHYIPEEEHNILQMALMQKQDAMLPKMSQRLHIGQDGRMRILVDAEIYQHIRLSSLEELYERLLIKVKSSTAQHVLEILVENQSTFTISQMLLLLEKRGHFINLENLTLELQQLSLSQWINLAEEKVEILHPYLYQYILKILQKGSLTEDMLPVNPETSITPNPNRSVQTVMRSNFPKSSKSFSTRKHIPLSPLSPPISSMLPSGNQQDSTAFLEKETAALKENYFPSPKQLEYISTYLACKEGSPNFKSTLEYLTALAHYLHNSLNLTTEVSQIIAALQSQIILSTINQPHPDLSLVVLEIFSENSLLFKSQKDPLTIAKIYALKYQLNHNINDWNLTIDNLYEHFSHLPVPNNVFDFIVLLENTEIKNEGISIENLKKNKSILSWTRKLFQLHFLQNKISTQHLQTFLPLQMPEYFHSYLIKYFEKIVQNENPPTDCFPLFYWNAFLVSQYPTFLNLIKEWVFDKRPIVQKLGLDMLFYCLPFIGNEEQEQVRRFLEDNIVQNSGAKVRLELLSNYSQCYISYEPEDLASFFYGLIKNEENPKIKINSCIALSKLHKFCSSEFQQEISEFITENFQKTILLGTADIEEYLKEINHLFTANNLTQLFPSLFKNIEKGEDKLAIRSAQTLAYLHYLMSQEEQQKYRTILISWLAQTGIKREFSLHHIYICYPDGIEYAEASTNFIIPEMFLENRVLAISWLSRCSSEVQQQIWQIWIGKLEETYLQNPEKKKQTLSIILNSLFAISYHFIEQTPTLNKYIADMLQNEDWELFFSSCKHIEWLLPYLAKEDKEVLQKLSWESMISSPPHHIWPLLLKILHGYSGASNEGNSNFFQFLVNTIKTNSNDLLEPILIYLASVQSLWPAGFGQRLKQELFVYLQFPNSAVSVIEFLLKCFKEVPTINELTQRYQYYGKTCHAAFALFEVFAGMLIKTPKLSVNYQKICRKNPIAIALQVAQFHQNSNNTTRAQELFHWIVKNDRRTLRLSALQKIWEWNVSQQKISDAQHSLDQYYETYFSVNLEIENKNKSNAK